MSAWGLQLISAILTAEDRVEVFDEITRKQCITPKMILNNEARAVFQYINEFHNRPGNYGRIPSYDKIREQFESLDLPPVQESVVDLCTYIRDEYLRSKIYGLRDTIEAVVQEDGPQAAIELIRKKADELTVLGSVDNDGSIVTELNEVLSEHLLKARTGQLMGVPFPWEELNEATQGIQEEDSILMYGIPKSMKTWILLYLAVTLFQKGFRVLIYSKEMQKKKLYLRMASIFAKLDYSRLRSGQLNDHDIIQLYTCVDQIHDALGGQDLIYTKASKADGSTGGVTDIRRKIEQYRPQIVLLDSAYLLANDRNGGNTSFKWHDLAPISQDIKGLAGEMKIPQVMIWQESEREALKSGSRGRGTSSLAMATQLIYDCDLAMRLVLLSDLNKMSIHITAAREVKFKGFTIRVHPGYDFGFDSWDLYDIDADTTKEVKSAGQEVSAKEAAKLSRLYKEMQQTALKKGILPGDDDDDDE